MKPVLTVQATIDAPIEKIWMCWTEPAHIMNWNSASDDWHTVRAENDLHVGGVFLSRMEAKDGSFGFDFGGTYTNVEPMKAISYTMGDGRKVDIAFEQNENGVMVTERFEAEGEHSLDMQKNGWQAILDHFKTYVLAL